MGEGGRTGGRTGGRETEAGVKYFRIFCREGFTSSSARGRSQSARVPWHLRLLRQDGRAQRRQAPCELGAI